MDSTRYAGRRIERSAVIALLAAILTGCSSTTDLVVSAPRSTVTRENALRLAQQFATTINGRVYAIAPSGSMRPVLDECSIVTVERVPIDRLKKGDIVVYRNRAGIEVIHRLYECHDGLWFVLGDNNPSIDRETVSGRNLLGRVCAIFYTSTANREASLAPSIPTAAALHGSP